MLIFLLIFLLISNAVTMRRDKSILFSRIVIKSLILIAFIAYNNLHLSSLSKGIALYGGLFNVTTFTQTFNIFILLVSAVILTLTIIGFFGKQMILRSGLDNGYVFMYLVAILTSVIGAGYYLNLIKQIFFYKDNYKVNPAADNVKLSACISEANINVASKIHINKEDIKINSSLSVTISILTFLIVLFIYIPTEWFNIVSILIIVIFIL